MFEAQFGRRKSWPDGLAHSLLITESSAQRTNRTPLANEQRAANRTGPLAFRFHHSSLPRASRVLVDSVSNGLHKMGL